jgi:hypothetical protein
MNAPNLVDLLAAEWAQQEPPRQSLVGRIVGALCLAIVVFNIVYFGGQLLRVFL